MSGNYAYLLKNPDGEMVRGGPSRYHCFWNLDYDTRDRQTLKMLTNGFTMTRITPEKCVDMTEKMVKELQKKLTNKP